MEYPSLEESEEVKPKIVQQKQVYQQQELQQQQTQQHQENPYKSEEQILFQADIYQQAFGNWQIVQNAKLTSTSFVNFKIQNLSKIKVKA